MSMTVCCICGLPVLSGEGVTVATQQRRWRLCETDANLQDWEISAMAQWLAEVPPNEVDDEAQPFDPSEIVGANIVESEDE